MMNRIIVVGILLTAGFACAEKPYKSNDTAAQSTPQSYERSTAADAENKTLTPTDQMEGSKADIELTRKIREMITDEDALSMKAQNVKIITLKGITTLRGPVNTMAEKRKIEQLARSAGAKSIKNQLEVTTKTE